MLNPKPKKNAALSSEISRMKVVQDELISIHTGSEEGITALTDDGIDELKDMLHDARRSPDAWRGFLEDFVADPDIIVRVKENGPR